MDKKNALRGLSVLLFVFCCILVPRQSWAADDSVEDGVKTNGVIIDMAQDRKVVKVGGIYQPEALDRYMDRRFSGLEEKMTRLENELRGVNQKLDEISAKLKEQSDRKSVFEEKK